MVQGKKTKQQKETFKCLKCQVEQSISNYYTSYNDNIAAKVIPYCKSCLQSMILDDDGIINENKLKETLKLMNRPFIQDLWNKSKEDGRNEFGSYIKNLALPQHRKLTWEDSVYEGFIVTSPIGNKDEKFFSKEWSGFYTQTEIDYLDGYLQGLYDDFKIITTNHRDYAKKIAQASLAVNKAYQDMLNGDSGADKRYDTLQKTFDTLSQSAKFSEKTRGQNDVALGCFGRVFEQVENHQYVPQHIPLDKDDIDKLIDQFNNIGKSI